MGACGPQTPAALRLFFDSIMIVAVTCFLGAFICYLFATAPRQEIRSLQQVGSGSFLAYQESSGIRHDLIFFSERIPVSNDAVIADSAVAAGARTDQRAVDPADPEEIGIAQQRQNMEQLMLLREFRVGALCETVAGDTVLPVLRLVLCLEPRRPGAEIIPVP